MLAFCETFRQSDSDSSLVSDLGIPPCLPKYLMINE